MEELSTLEVLLVSMDLSVKSTTLLQSLDSGASPALLLRKVKREISELIASLLLQVPE